MDQFYVTILAGGLGKRMGENFPKVLRLVKNIPMIVGIINQILELFPIKIFIVVSPLFANIIKSTVEKYIINDRIVYVEQPNALGTADAVKCVLPFLDLDVANIILNGDVPFIKKSTIQKIYQYYMLHKSSILITAINLSNPTGNGRVLLNINASPYRIVEEKDCDDIQKNINLVNCGIYIIKSTILKNYIPLIDDNNAQKEYYITDIIQKTVTDRHVCGLFILDKDQEYEIYNINTQQQLQIANDL